MTRHLSSFKIQKEVSLGDGYLNDAFWVKGMGSIDVHGMEKFDGRVTQALVSIHLPGLMFIEGVEDVEWERPVYTHRTLNWDTEAECLGLAKIDGTLYGVDTISSSAYAEPGSTSLGKDAKASGEDSVAIGTKAEANASASLALGPNATVDSENVGRVGVEQLVYGSVQGSLPDSELGAGEMTVVADEDKGGFVLKYRDGDAKLQSAMIPW